MFCRKCNRLLDVATKKCNNPVCDAPLPKSHRQPAQSPIEKMNTEDFDALVRKMTGKMSPPLFKDKARTYRKKGDL